MGFLGKRRRVTLSSVQEARLSQACAGKSDLTWKSFKSLPGCRGANEWDGCSSPGMARRAGGGGLPVCRDPQIQQSICRLISHDEIPRGQLSRGALAAAASGPSPRSPASDQPLGEEHNRKEKVRLRRSASNCSKAFAYCVTSIAITPLRLEVGKSSSWRRPPQPKFGLGREAVIVHQSAVLTKIQ